MGPTADLSIADAVSQLIGIYQEARRKIERREASRVEFIQPVVVTTQEGQNLTVLSRDLSVTGIRLIGTRRLLGQKIRLRLGEYEFVARVLWSCPVGDDLVENGGNFLSVRQLDPA
ncbi:MAG: PilZ domain-containing protein [Gemmataceae bacterium]